MTPLTRMPRRISNSREDGCSGRHGAIRRGWPQARWRFALLLVIALFAHAAWAAREIRVEPHFMFYFGYGFYLDDLHESPEDAFAYLKTFYDVCRNGGCNSNENLRPQPPDQPFGFRFNGIPYWWIWDQFFCWSGGCNEYIGVGGGITAWILCPQEPLRFGAKQILTDPIDREVVCVGYLPDQEPCYDDCEARGNPIHPGTGQKLLVEADYAGPLPGLEFQRVYRSSNGYFASPVTAGWVDQSVAHAESGGCYPGIYFFHNRPYAHCYPYIGSGSQSYRLATADGHSLDFTGPADTITAKADVAERVTRHTGAGGAIEWEIRRKDNSIEIYDARGLLIRRTLVGGRTLHYTYSDATTPATVAPRPGLLIRMADRFGHALDFAYDAGARMVRMADPAGGLYDYAYDSAGNLAAVTYPDGRSRRYHYNEAALINGGAACSGHPNGLPRALTGVTDENGVRYATYGYDCDGRAVSTEHAGGVGNYHFTYASPYAANFSTTETDPLGTTRTHTYATTLGIARRTATTQPAPAGTGTVTEALGYDAHGNVVSRTDFNGHRTIYAYDLGRNLEISRTEASGTPEARTITTEWHPQFRLPTRIAEPGRTTTFGYDDRGNRLSRTETATATGQSRSWHWTYDADGQVLTEDGPRTDVNDATTYTYDPASGNLITVRNALGHLTTYGDYDPHGQPGRITDPNGRVTLLSHDARGRLIRRSDDGQTTTLDYDGTGQPSRVTLPDGTFYRYTYDSAHRLTGIADDLGNRREYTLDPMGNRIAEETFDAASARVQTHRQTFDALSRLAQDLGATGQTTTYAYDAKGHPTGIIDPLGHATSVTYDSLDRPVTLTDPAGSATRLNYDGLDHFTQISDPRGLVTRYRYDGLDRLLEVESPDTGLTQLTYDAAGNLKTRTDARGMTTAFDYDAADRLIRIDYGDSAVALTYDTTHTFCADPAPAHASGQLASLADDAGTTDWCYDRQGRIHSRTQTTAGPFGMSLGLDYGWGDAGPATGHLTTLSYPSGAVIRYTYAQGRVVSLSLDAQPLLTAIRYQPFGPVSGWIWGDGTWGPPHLRGYDLDGRISAYPLAADPAEEGPRLVDYDAASRITAYQHPGDPSLDQSFGYDALDRLSSFTGNPETLAWSYDPTGNRAGQTGTVAVDYTVDPSSNRLLGTTGPTSASYTYDAAGNLIDDGVHRYRYDGRGRLVAVEGPFGKAEYAYNGLGQRVGKLVSDAAGTPLRAITFLYDQAGHLLGEYDGITQQPIQETVYLGDIPVAVIQPTAAGPAVYFVYADHLDTPRVIWNAQHQKVWTWTEADSFGTALPDENPSGLGNFSFHLRFPGQYYDAETGLHHNGFRDYHPGLGRYVESDPIGLVGGINTYAYVGNNPTNLVDPFGLREYPDNFIGPLEPSGYYTSQMTRTKCGRIPPAPPGVNVNSNMSDARSHFNPFWFYDQVRNKGPWDYKQQGPLYEDFGNFNFGATGNAFGFPPDVLQRGAGWANQKADPTRTNLGSPWGAPPYGDDWYDYLQIRRGINFCECTEK